MGLLGFNYNDGYDDFGRAAENSDFMAVLGLMIGFIVILVIIAWAISLAVCLVLYILRSIGLYRLSENRGIGGSGLAWIPFIGFYRIGSIADDIVARNGGRSYYKYVLLVGGIVNIAGGIVSWLFTTIAHPALYQFFSNPFNSYYSLDDATQYRSEFFTYWGVSLLLSMISIALYILTVIALNKIYRCYRPASSTSWTVLSVIFPFMQSIFPFVIRNAVPASEWGAQGYYPMQNTGPNWQTPPQYPSYDQQPPVNGGYPPQNQGWQPSAPPSDAFYQPPAAPNPPEPWELDETSSQPAPRAPWEQNENGGN